MIIIMACYKPLEAFSYYDEDTGERKIRFTPGGERIFLPCGQCIGCRIARSREWATRLVHEASLHDANCFITLTYSPEHLPKDGSVHVKDFQDFMKRLRFKFRNVRIRFFHCGEYGSKLGRPHYHAIIFGFDFPDKELFFVSPNGDRVYRSKALEELWTFGISSIGEVTFQSCAYVARYVIKKMTGDKAGDHYQGKHPEYVTMSRRPGIASGWIEEYSSDVYPQDFVVLDNGKKIKTPRFYDKKFQELDPELFSEISSERAYRAAKKFNERMERFGSIFEMYRDLGRKNAAKRYKIDKHLPRNLENA